MIINQVQPQNGLPLETIQKTVRRPIAATIPFGFGFKFNLGERWGLGIEYQMRKMFLDKLDNLDDPIAFVDDEGKEHYYTDKWHNNDWSGYLGMHVTYKLYIGKKACPTYESKE